MHHSPTPDPEMNAMVKETLNAIDENKNELPKDTPLGPTGQFPEGKLTDKDEGETAFRIGTVEGKVVLEFGEPTAWVGMSPEQAMGLAKILYKRAKHIIRQKIVISGR